MPYDDKLADKIRKTLLPHRREMEEKKMMGGLTFMFRGKMCCGIVGDTLMVRVVEEKYSACLEKPHCRKMDFTGKPLKGFLYVDSGGIRTEKQLGNWLALGVEFVESRGAGQP